MSLGENLQFLRKKNNITQEQLAEQLDVSRQSVSKWESDSSYPEMDKLLQLNKIAARWPAKVAHSDFSFS